MSFEKAFNAIQKTTGQLPEQKQIALEKMKSISMTDVLNSPEIKNIDICKQAHALSLEYPNRTIKFECFNEQEAEWFERYMAKFYPDVKFFTTWMY